MESLSELRGSKVFLDTSPIIYYIERHPRYIDLLRPFFEAIEAGEIVAVTSSLTLTEVLVHPLRRGDHQLAELYRAILSGAEGLEIRPITTSIAEGAARVRAAHNIKTPDAMQLATALDVGATAFLSNDRDLPSISGLRIIVLDEVLAAS